AKDVRAKIIARYLAPGTQLDLYARGAAVGSFEVAAEEGSSGCQVKATGHRRNVPSTVMDFLALLSDDPVKLAALTFPGEPQTDAKTIARAALAQLKSGTAATPAPVEVSMVRRFRESGVSVMAVDASVNGTRVLAIAEGNGLDAGKWKVVWSTLGD